MIEGPGGFLRNTHPSERPLYEPSKRRITWKNGSWATVFSDDEPDQLRGFSGDTAWLDEAAKFKNFTDVWSNLQFGMRERSTDQPRILITTTPRPLKLLVNISKAKNTVTVEGSSYDNRDNLDESWFSGLTKYEGTRLGRQEIYGEILEDAGGALWTRKVIDDCRVTKDQVPSFRRVVVAIDPAVTSGEEADETGIVVVGLGQDGHGYVLEDGSGRYKPMEWAVKAIELKEKWNGDRVVGEVNNGGEMVGNTLRMAGLSSNSFKAVHASHGKVTRAEPVSTLYEQNPQMVHHVGGDFADLEDQMTSFTIDFDKKAAGYSPDRVDALVWAITELMVERMKADGIFEYYRRSAESLGVDTTRIELDVEQQLRTAKPPPLPSSWEFVDPAKAAKAPEKVKLRVPRNTSAVFGMSGARYMPKAGMIEASAEDAQGLLQQGFQKVS